MKTKVSNKYEAACATYLFPAMYDRRKNLNRAIATLKVDCMEFDTIVCTGVSGVLFASPLALLMGKNLVVVRKQRDASHSSNKIEANCKPKEVGKWLFVDDLVDSGATRTRVIKAIDKWTDTIESTDTVNNEYVGDYLYESGSFQDP
jgi:adenine/guanine phosphoribosyltransferase-like PRPP-binding protein